MKLLLLLTLGMGLAWTLQGQSQVSVQPGFNPKQVAGSWITLKLASTEKSVIEEEGAYECFMTGIALLNNGNLNVTYFHRKDGKCVEEFYVAEKTDVPGRYTFECSEKEGKEKGLRSPHPAVALEYCVTPLKQMLFRLKEHKMVLGDKGKNYLTFVVVTDDYTIIDLENQREGNTLIVVELHGRKLHIDERALKAYRSHVYVRGIVPDNIVDVSLKRCKNS